MKAFKSKGKIKFIGITIVFMIVMLLALSTKVKAASDITLKLSLRKETKNGSFWYYGYATKGAASNEFNIWKVVKVNGGNVDTTTDFYCIKGGPGFGSNGNTGTLSAKTYKDIGNLKDITAMRNNSVYNALLPQSDNAYHQLLWLFDNFYTPNSSNTLNEKKSLLVKAGIITASQASSLTAEQINNNKITDEQVLAVQQLAVWNITNNLPSDSRFYNEYVPTTQAINPYVLPENDETKYAPTAANGWTNLEDMYDGDDSFGENMDALYRYFCNTAASKSSYTPNSVSGNNFITKTTNSATAVENGSNYVIGPYKFTVSNANIDFSLTSYSFKDDNGHTANGVTIQGASASQTEATLINNIKNGTQFYLVVPKSSIVGDVANYSFNLAASATVTDMEYWSEDHAVNGVNQPVAQIKRNVYTSSAKVTTTPEPEKVFDLALRKWLKTVDGQLVTNSREPNIDKSTIASDHTATYKHRKDPYMVNVGSRVVFAIKIYNEGEVSGKCTKITDYLPADLTFATNSSINTAYKWKQGSSENEYYTDYLKDVSIPAYDGTNLHSSNEVLIECVVKNNPEYNVITNIAEITSFTRDDGKTGDRDSEGGNATIPSDVTRPNYKGNSSNTGLDESSPDSYFEGQEDDDDFDKITVQPFDLALRKNVYSVNGETLEARGETTKNPDIDPAKLRSGQETTAVYNHRKNPTKVKVGDKVVFNITVYNEGPTSGYASLIEDYLPQGLEMVVSDDINSINNQYGWTLEDASRRKVKTNILSYESDRTGNLLNAYDGSTLSSKTIKIECVVTDAANTDGLVLTDIASILEYRDSANKVITDRDSYAANLNYVDGTQLANYRGLQSNPTDLTKTNYFYEGQEDDDDFDKLIVEAEEPQEFDLALRKWLKSVDGNAVTDTREPNIDNSTIDEYGTATYKHRKDPYTVNAGSRVVFAIKVYNEGGVSGKCTKITDYLPADLTLATDSTINNTYGWRQGSSANEYYTEYLKNTSIPAYDGRTLHSSDEVLIECVVNNNPSYAIITNIAEISAYTRDDGKTGERDSTPNNATIPDNSQRPGYNGNSSNSGLDASNPDSYFKGQEDDDDFDKIRVNIRQFDLKLIKHITNLNVTKNSDQDATTYNRSQYNFEALRNNTSTSGTDTLQATKKASPVEVKKGDIIEYTINVYNEGDISGFAQEITENIPEGLQFLYTDKATEADIYAENGLTDAEKFALYSNNVFYKWKMYDAQGNETTNVANAKTLKTNYLSKENSQQGEYGEGAYATNNSNLLLAYNRDTMSEGPHSHKVVVYLKVATNVTGEPITNLAHITDDADENGRPVDDRDSKTDVGPGVSDEKGSTVGDYDDDEDYDEVILKKFDLALRKYITKIDTDVISSRVPRFTLNKDANGNYIYEHDKTPLLVETSDIVEYTIRVYNEGDVNGYAKLIKDDIPDGLQFIPQSENTTNQTYRWVMLDASGNVTNDVTKAVSVQTDYLSREQGEVRKSANHLNENPNLIRAFNAASQINESNPDHKEVVIAFKVVAPGTTKSIITNTAEIKDDENENGEDVDDVDSTPNNNNPNEDDQDVEHIKLQYFDLALRKFITDINGTEVNTRIPQFTIDGNGKYVYNHSKDPLDVCTNQVVTYTIRVYNEGTMDGYASLVKDDLPDGLEFLPENSTNTSYEWEMVDKDGKVTTNVANAVAIQTDYLSKDKERGGRENLIKAFDLSAYQAGTITEPSYKTVKIVFKVIEPNTSSRVLINQAQIADDKDKDGNDVVDIDSTPGVWVEGEDDQDIEKVKVKYFDLALRKWITETVLIEGGKQKVVTTGHNAEDDPEAIVKVELYKGTLSSAVVKFRYSIRVTNQGEIEGYATEISDYIPEGLEFLPSENPEWTEKDGKVTTDILKDTLLRPGESAEVDILLQWINGSSNLGLKTNTAEISEDSNPYGTPDIDSTPNNQVPGEDDIDIAEVMLSIKTGTFDNSKYVIIAFAAFTIVTSSIVLIRKYVA